MSVIINYCYPKKVEEVDSRGDRIERYIINNGSLEVKYYEDLRQYKKRLNIVDYICCLLKELAMEKYVRRENKEKKLDQLFDELDKARDSVYGEIISIVRGHYGDDYSLIEKIDDLSEKNGQKTTVKEFIEAKTTIEGTDEKTISSFIRFMED